MALSPIIISNILHNYVLHNQSDGCRMRLLNEINFWISSVQGIPLEWCMGRQHSRLLVCIPGCCTWIAICIERRNKNG